MSEKKKDEPAAQNSDSSFCIVVVYCTFIHGIIEELILYNIRDRVLLLSSERDGFDFFDDSDRLWVENHRIFSIRNESKNNICLVLQL